MKKRALVIGEMPNIIFATHLLVDRGYQVAVIGRNRKEASETAEMTNVPVLYGDELSSQILTKSKMQGADIALVMLPKDEDNFVVSLLCKRFLKIKKIITVLKDNHKMKDFYQAGIDSVVCENASIASMLDQQEFLDGMATLVPISGGRVNVMEVPIYESAPIVGKKLWEIELPGEVIVGCILRKEHSIVPRGDTRILAGDILILIASDQQEVAAVRKITGHDIKNKI